MSAKSDIHGAVYILQKALTCVPNPERHMKQTAEQLRAVYDLIAAALELLEGRR